MPLSEHEQRMLEEIENALYAEDPKFASSVKSRRLGKADGRRRLQAFAVFVIGLVLLVGGLAIGLKVGGFPIVSLIGFLVMFSGGLLALWGDGPPSRGAAGPAKGKGARGGRSGNPGKRSLSVRMEERFNRRFEQE